MKGTLINMKRLLALFICTAILICYAPFTVSANERITEDGIKYTVSVNGGYVTVTGYTGENTILTVPAEIDGYPVKYIGSSAFAGNPFIETVFVPESIVGIRDSAFVSCKSLESVYIENVEAIGYGAFSDCASLKTVEINGGLKTVDQLAFGDCPLLSSVILPEGVSQIGASVFSNCISLEAIDIPDSVRTIGAYAFKGCYRLKSIDLPNVLSIDVGVFEECSALENIEIPITVDSIGNRAFMGCSTLKEITIPPLVTSIGAYAFGGCTSLSCVNILPCGLEKIDQGAFAQCISLERLTIPRTVTFIGNGVTDGCESLSGIDYHGSRQEWNKIDTNENNDQFLSVTVKYHPVATKSPFVFEYDRESLTATLTGYNSATAKVLEIPSEFNGYTVTTIKSVSNNNCSPAFRDITVPSTVTVIGPGAFERCAAIERLTIHAGLEKIGAGAFCYGVDECIYFIGTEDEWNSIEIDEKSNSLFLSAKIKFVRNGDCNGDGKQDAKDAYLLKGYLAGKISIESIDIERADMNGDGIITAADSFLLRKKLVGA